MYRYRSIVLALVVLAFSGILAGCRVPFLQNQDTAQSAPVLVSTRSTDDSARELDPACVVGLWMVADLPQAMGASFSQSRSDLKLDGVDGQAHYEFLQDGTMKIAFYHLTATLSGLLDHRPVTAQQSLDGSATAQYQVDASEKEVVLSDFGGEGIEFALAVNDQVLVEGDLPIWRAFTSGISQGEDAQPTPLVQYSRVAVACSGDTMSIRAVDPIAGPEVDLRKIK